MKAKSHALLDSSHELHAHHEASRRLVPCESPGLHATACSWVLVHCLQSDAGLHLQAFKAVAHDAATLFPLRNLRMQLLMQAQHALPQLIDLLIHPLIHPFPASNISAAVSQESSFCRMRKRSTGGNWSAELLPSWPVSPRLPTAAACLGTAVLVPDKGLETPC